MRFICTTLTLLAAVSALAAPATNFDVEDTGSGAKLVERQSTSSCATVRVAIDRQLLAQLDAALILTDDSYSRITRQGVHIIVARASSKLARARVRLTQLYRRRHGRPALCHG